MAFSVTDIADPTLRKLVLAVAGSMKPAAGNTLYIDFLDRLENAVPTNVPSDKSQAGNGSEFQIVININPGGLSANAKVVAKSPMPQEALVGQIDITTLATKLV